jgi:hypothetical protein
LDSEAEDGSVNESIKSSVLGPLNTSISDFENSFTDLIKE